jgi:hypothetical protein
MSYPYAVESAERWMACAVSTLEDAVNGLGLSERELGRVVDLVELVAQFKEIMDSPEGQQLLNESKKLREIELLKFKAFYAEEKAKHAQEIAQHAANVAHAAIAKEL